MQAKTQVLSFIEVFKYPFNRPVGLLNILWVFFPIFGWFALTGYGIRIIKEIIQGNSSQLPLFSFWEDLKFGFFMFVKMLPLIVTFLLVLFITESIHEYLGAITNIILNIFIAPLLTINFFQKETIASSFEFSILSTLTEHLGDYLIALFKSIGLGILYLFLILFLVGIPALQFTQNIFFADFYRRFVLKKEKGNILPQTSL